MILNLFFFTFPKKWVRRAMGNETFYGDGLIEVYRPSARNCLKRQFRHRHRDHETSRVWLNKLVRLLRKRKLRERTKSIIKHSFPKSSKIRDTSENYKGFHVNFLHRNDCFFSAYFINMNLQRFAHSNKFSTFASGGKRTEIF